MGKLNFAAVRAAKPGLGPDGKPTKRILIDGDGLSLVVAPSGARNWMLRVAVEGKRRDIGLGALDADGAGRKAFGPGDARMAETSLMLTKSLSLPEAREKAAALRKLAKAGADPVAERDRERRQVLSFAEVVAKAHSGLKDGWGEKTAKAFLSSLEDHAIPKLGKLKVDVIGAADIIGALAPIWTDKPVMARKVRSRIGQVLAFAKAQGWRTDALPDVREMRSGLSKQARGGNFAAMPFVEVPAFVADQLALPNSSSRAAMLFAILTAARSGEVRQATWEQIDLETATWTRTAEMMKMKVAHIVTLCPAAVALLERHTPEGHREGLVFLGRKEQPLSDMALTKIMRLATRTETVHGFRSAFRDWAAEKMPTVPAMVAEMALAHKVGTATEQAYLRSDMREMRRALLDAWGRFVAPSLSPSGSNVVEIAPKAVRGAA